MKAIAGTLLLAVLATSALAQTVAVLPVPSLTPFFDNSGRPLAGGLLYTCVAGSACPGTPQASYVDAGGTTPNANPVVLDASGKAPVWLLDSPYKLVIKTSTGVTLLTIDNVSLGGYADSGPWLVSGTTIYNGTAGTKVCIGATPCTTALAQLQVSGTSSGNNYLVRIDDSGNSPGINLYGSGNSLGSYAADSAGLRLRDGNAASQMVVSTGSVLVQNAGAGSTTLTVRGGAGQGSANLVSVKNAAGVEMAYVDSEGRYLGNLYNAAPALGTDTAFQTATSSFSVNGDGDISSNGGINATGANGNSPYKVAGVEIVDASRNAHFNTLTCDSTPCGSGGGGGGTPGGSTTQVQYNNAGAFGGSANFTWSNAGQLLTVNATGAGAAGIAVATGFIQSATGFASPTATAYNTVQAPLGGMAARSFTATKYIQAGNNSGAPTVTGSDAFQAGALYWDTGSSAMQVYDGASWVSLGGGSGSPGGATTNVQYNSAGSFAGSGNFTWDNAGQLLTVTAVNAASPGLVVDTGFVQSAEGFLATGATATAYNSIQAPAGGVAARSLTATTYIQAGSGSSDPTVTTSDTFNPGAMYWNTASGAMKVYNGSAWVNLTGSGGGTPGGATTNVQFNSSGSFGGSSAFTWNTGAQLMTVTALNSASPGIAVGTGYVQSDAGFLATVGTAVNYNAIQAPGGGIYAKSLRAINYTQVGSSFGIPSTTTGDSYQPGALYFNTALGALQVFNGATWTSLSGGGGGGVTSTAGTTNQVLVNGGTGAQTGAITLSLPQSIGTTSFPTFGGVTASSSFTVANAFGNSFQTSNGNFQAGGNGVVYASNSFNTPGSFQVGGNVVINSSRQFIGNGVDVGSNGIQAGGYNVFGGFIGQTWTIGFSTPFTINGSGSYTQLYVRGGVIVAATP